MRTVGYLSYDIIECPHPEDPFKACVDINADSYHGFSFSRAVPVAYRDEYGNLAFAHPLFSEKAFNGMLKGGDFGEPMVYFFHSPIMP